MMKTLKDRKIKEETSIYKESQTHKMTINEEIALELIKKHQKLMERLKDS